MIHVLILAASMAAVPPALQQARDRQDRPALEKLAAEQSAAAAQKPGDADAQYRAALAWSYAAQVAIEQRDRKAGRQAAEQGIKLAEKAVSLKPTAENYCVLATLYGQAVTDLMSGLSFGPKAKDAINKAVQKAPNSGEVYLARGVGSYYLPVQLGGGPAAAIADFRKAIGINPKNAEAYVWLGVALRRDNKDAEARQAFAKALELTPNRLWAKQQLDKTPAK
jgi:tetratricopeptide (TPR) repeat protein